MILVDTSIWIDHFHRSEPALVQALEREEVLTHPFVIGELACGTLSRRREVLDLMAELPRTALATNEEVLVLIEKRRLMSKGLGYIDVHLIASVLLTGDAQFWTRDRRLRTVAGDLAVRAPLT